MKSLFDATVLILVGVVVVYASILAHRMRRLEWGMRILVADVKPSQRVRELAGDPGRRIEAIRAFREEENVDVRAAMAVIDSLISIRG